MPTSRAQVTSLGGAAAPSRTVLSHLAEASFPLHRRVAAHFLLGQSTCEPNSAASDMRNQPPTQGLGAAALLTHSRCGPPRTRHPSEGVAPGKRWQG